MEQDLVVEPGSVLSGSLSHESGQPLAGEFVSVTSPEGLWITVQSEVDGSFTVPGLPATGEVIVDWFKERKARVALPCEELRLVRRKPRTARFMLTDASTGQPIEFGDADSYRARVVLFGERRTSSRCMPATSKRDWIAWARRGSTAIARSISPCSRPGRSRSRSA